MSRRAAGGVTVSVEVLGMIRERSLPGVPFRNTAKPDGAGLYFIPLDREVLAAIEAKRLVGESDDDVLRRLMARAS